MTETCTGYLSIMQTASSWMATSLYADGALIPCGIDEDRRPQTVMYISLLCFQQMHSRRGRKPSGQTVWSSGVQHHCPFFWGGGANFIYLLLIETRRFNSMVTRNSSGFSFQSGSGGHLMLLISFSLFRFAKCCCVIRSGVLQSLAASILGFCDHARLLPR